MSKRVLITGGAGFIGSHLADGLLKHDYCVRALDNLSSQVHGPNRGRPDYLNSEVELVVGDVRDPDAVRWALEDVDAVFHLAAMVGAGQSMYELTQYTEVNNLGTATLLEALITSPVERLVVASSMSLYGEGLYRAHDGSIWTEVQRTMEQLKAGNWEVTTKAGEILLPIPTPEWKQPSLASVYALSKYDQEVMSLMVGGAYGVPTVALRFFNVFGTRQALSNPYTGVLANFAARLLNDQPPLIFEDGFQQRDFVSVYDIVQACRLALEKDKAISNVFNVGSGTAHTIVEIAARMADVLGRSEIEQEVTGEYRMGDIRHCVADITRAQCLLGYEPRISLDEGIIELAEWLEGQTALDRVAGA
jgi:dTDP-L-rhamnose 4-epimerase